MAQSAFSPELSRASENVRTAIGIAAAGLVDRESLVETIALGAVAHEHVLVIGPPGTAKSEAVRRIARTIDASYFEYLIGRFTEPSEIFGPVDLKRLREGIVETETAGMLPEADIAFIDEVFLGSTAILNTLLGLLNERVYRRGHTVKNCPLRICVGAANSLPHDESLAAFADRFLLRVFLDPIVDSGLEDLLAGGWSAEREVRAHVASLADIDTLAAAARDCDMTAVRPLIAHAVRKLRSAGLSLTDRRVVKIQRLIAAAAVLAGRAAPGEGDLWPIILAIPTRDEQALARDVLRDVLSKSENPVTPAAAEDASAGPVARANRIVASARELFDQKPLDDIDEAWRLKLEGIAREIDAGFASDQMPEELATVRQRIVEIVSG